MATAKKLTEAARKAQAKQDTRVELVEVAARKVESLERMKERHAKEQAAAEDEIVTAVADVLDKGGWAVADARDFGLPVSQDARAEVRRRKAEAKSGNDQPSGRPNLAVVADPGSDDSAQADTPAEATGG